MERGPHRLGGRLRAAPRMASRLNSALQPDGSLSLISSRQATAAVPTTSTTTASGARSIGPNGPWARRRERRQSGV